MSSEPAGVRSGDASKEIAVPDALPVLPLRGAVVLPLTVMPIEATQARSIQLVDEAMRGNRLVALVGQKDPQIEQAGPDDVYRIGTMASIHRMARTPEGAVRLIVRGIERIRILDWPRTEPFLVARIELAAEVTDHTTESEALSRALAEVFGNLAKASPDLPEELAQASENFTEARDLFYFVASVAPLDAAVKQELLEMDPVSAKIRRLIDLLQKEVAVRELGRKIASDTEERLTKKQRDFYLREQLRSIQQELGEDGGDPELAELKQIGRAHV